MVMDDAWDRTRERTELWDHFEHDRNIAMFAPRRLGKTWLMKNLLKQEADSKGWRAIYCDLQGANTCENAVMALVRDIEKTGGLGGNFVDHVKAKFTTLLSGDVNSLQDLMAQTDWTILLDVTLSRLADSVADRPVIILLDEVTVCAARILAHSPKDGRRFLDTLRKSREDYPAIRWMLTGSIGLDHLADAYQISGAFNNLEPFLIEPFSDEIADQFVQHYCRTETQTRFSLTEAVLVRLRARLGWLSPFYLERICLRVNPSICKGNQYEANEEDIDRACGQLLEYPYNRAFSGWPDHLGRNINNEERPACKAVLARLCQYVDGETEDALRMVLEPEYTTGQIRRALRTLTSDGFLTKGPGDGRYRFAMQLLADYWREYHA